MGYNYSLKLFALFCSVLFCFVRQLKFIHVEPQKSYPDLARAQAGDITGEKSEQSHLLLVFARDGTHRATPQLAFIFQFQLPRIPPKAYRSVAILLA